MSSKKDTRETTHMFRESQSSFMEKWTEDTACTPVECLGRTYPNDSARREHFLGILAERLRDPEFRKIEGFPIATDADILRLSDPPYFTACPNPFLAEFVHCHAGAPKEDKPYTVTPYAKDQSHGKGDLLYSAHCYHTKVPPQAIAKYILHYTNPGDLVYDPFGGSGMTGFAAKLCGQRSIVDPDNQIEGVQWGCRLAVCGDTSPAATLIQSVYLRPPLAEPFEKSARSLLSRVVAAERAHWTVKGNPVHYFVIGEIFFCPACTKKIVSWDVVKMTTNEGSAAGFHCPQCTALVSKQPARGSGASRLERRLTTRFDSVMQEAVTVRNEEYVAAFIEAKGGMQLFEFDETHQAPDVEVSLPATSTAIPTRSLIQGDRALLKDCCAAYGIERLHQFFTPRQLRYVAALYEGADVEQNAPLRNSLLFLVQSYLLGATRLNRFIPARKGKSVPGSQVNRYFSGTLYIPSMTSEVSPNYLYANKITRLGKVFRRLDDRVRESPSIVTTQSATARSELPDRSVDYIFVDPPFGQNLQYSELNQIWEGWLGVFQDRCTEAVIDVSRERNVMAYTNLMKQALAEMYRVLKPGRWLTLEFHNSENAVWNGVQEALFCAGFVVADVRILDKKQETYKQSRQRLTKKDLVISAYRPVRLPAVQAGFSGEEDEEQVWEFVREHLSKLPVIVVHSGHAELMVERTEHMLFNRMVAAFVQRGLRLSMSSWRMAEELEERFPKRDDMFFLPDQVLEYDRKRHTLDGVHQLELFISDEDSAIAWLRHTLAKKPETQKELTTAFLRCVDSWKAHELNVDLVDLLTDNFLCYSGIEPVPSQIHSYLSTNFKSLRNLEKDAPALRAKAADRWYVPDPKKEGDLEKLRLRTLLREFEDYRTSTTRKIKQFRTEAVRAGFKHCYDEQNYQTIVELAAKLPEKILQEDEKLLMYYDVATMRLGEDE